MSDERIAALEAELDRMKHAVGALQRLAFALKELVPRAFEEGFRRRIPDTEEPWLVDWLQSETKQRLETLVPKPARMLGDPPPKRGGVGDPE